LERLHYAEEKHVQHVRIFRVLKSFHVKAAGTASIPGKPGIPGGSATRSGALN